MITGSPAAGVTASWIASAGLPGTKVAAPGRWLSCTMWKTGIRLARAHRRVSAMRATAFGPVRQHHLADRGEVLLLGIDDEERGLVHRGALVAQRVRVAGCPPTWTFESASRPRIQLSHASARFCSSTCFSSSARSFSRPSGAAAVRSSVLTT